MKILVTGGAGFIASHITDSYIKLGHDVVIVDNLSTGKKENINPKATFYEVDIRSPELGKIFEKEKPEIVCHHAAQMDVRVSVEKPQYDADVNIAGLLNILQNAYKTGVKRIIFASSGGVVYGDTNQLPCTEELPKKPLSPYGIAKWTSELYLNFYASVLGMEYVALRYANVYGPRQAGGEAGVIAIFIKQMLKNKQCLIFGDGTQLRDYVYVADVVRANVAALTKGKNIGINIGTSVPTSVNKLYDNIAEIMDFNIKAKHMAARPGELYKNYLDNSLARKILDWEPKIELISGLKKTIDFFKEEL